MGEETAMSTVITMSDTKSLTRGDTTGAAQSEGSVSPRSGALSRVAVATAWVLALTLPLVGFLSLLFRSKLDPEWNSPRLHVMLFLGVGGGAFILAYLAGQAADRRGDARVFLLS